MIRQSVRSMAWLAVSLIVVVSSAYAQPKPDTLALLKTQGDSICAVMERVLLHQDSALLMSVVSDTIGVVMPGNKTTSGRESVARYLPLLFSMVGGFNMEATRIKIELVPGYQHLARQAGGYTLSRTDAAGQSEKRQGKYVVYWSSTDTSWTVERIFVSKK